MIQNKPTDRAAVQNTIPQGLEVCVAQLAQLSGKRFVTYFPALGKLLGSTKAALMLGHGLYLTKYLQEKEPEREGWFWKSQNDWFVATGLSKREQASARKCLIDTGVLLETRHGMPSRMYYKLSLDALARFLTVSVAEQSSANAWSWEESAVRTLLGKPISFYAPLAWTTGSASSGLVLSLLIAQAAQLAKAGNIDRQGFHPLKNNKQWQAFGIGEKTVAKAREQLEAAGFLSTQRSAKVMGTLVFKLNTAAIVEKTTEITNEINRLLVSSSLDCGKLAICFLPKRTSGFSQNALLVSPETHNSFLPKRTSESAETSKPLIRFYKLKKLQQLRETQAEIGAEPKTVVAVSDQKIESTAPQVPFIYPSFLLAQEKTAFAKMLCLRGDGQIFIDEIAGKAAAQHGSVRSPVALLNKLLQLDLEGAFYPAYAAKVQQARDTKQLQVQMNSTGLATDATTELTDSQKQINRDRIAGLRQLIRRSA